MRITGIGMGMGIDAGLAMDYEVFRLTRMREAYVHGASPGEAITVGFRYGGRGVAAAAVIMEVGLSTAVALFAFVVRRVIAPAVPELLGGHRAWWPRILRRVLPNADSEGEALGRGRVPAPATEPDAAVS